MYIKGKLLINKINYVPTRDEKFRKKVFHITKHIKYISKIHILLNLKYIHAYTLKIIYIYYEKRKIYKLIKKKTSNLL